MNKPDLVLKANKAVGNYDKNMEKGMSHEEGYDWAERFRDLLCDFIDVVQKDIK